MEKFRAVGRESGVVSYSGHGGYVIFEPIVDSYAGLIKVLIPVPEDQVREGRPGYRMDFHLITLDTDQSFECMGHQVRVLPTTVYLDDEELHITDQVPSPVRSPINQSTVHSYELVHEFCELGN